MSVKVDGYKSSAIFEQLKTNITDNEARRKETIKKVLKIIRYFCFC
jgi:hypothetical protein